MYNEFFGFSEEPFRLTPDPSFFFKAMSHRQALSSLIAGIEERKGILTITGDVGTGKTTLINTLVKGLNEQIKTAFIFNPRLTFKQLLKSILGDLKVPVTGNSTDILLHRFDLYLQKRAARDEIVLIIVDEAQHLSTRVLENLDGLFQRQTLAAKPLQVILAGQLELENNLNSEESRPFKRRIALHHRLSPFNWEESKAYIDHRLKIVGGGISEVFTPEAVDLICDFAKGVPRVINTICDRALLAGYSFATPKIGAMIVKAVISEEMNITQEVPFHLKEASGDGKPGESMKYRWLRDPVMPGELGLSDVRGESMKKGTIGIVQGGKKLGLPAILETIKKFSWVWLYSSIFLGRYKSLKEKYIALEVKNNILQKQCIELEAQIGKKEAELNAIQESIKIEEEKRRRTEDILAPMEARVQYLSSEFLDLQEKDKKFIAGDLLYIIMSLILSLKSGVEDILHIRKGESDAALFNFEQTLCNLQNGIQKAVEILAWLYPPTLDDPGIMPTIKWYCHEFQKRHPRFQIAQEIDIQDDEIVNPLKTQVFRILQEALAMVAEHSKGDRAYISIIKKDRKLHLKVEENGQGFDLPRLFSEIKDLTRIKQRAELSGGYLSIESGETLGVSIRASWPI